MFRFAVTYGIVTPESAEDGDEAESGFIGQALTLRDALQELHATRTSKCGGVECIECDEMPVRAPRWITVTNGAEFATGACESRSLHIPAGVTPASRRRIAQLAGVRC